MTEMFRAWHREGVAFGGGRGEDRNGVAEEASTPDCGRAGEFEAQIRAESEKKGREAGRAAGRAKGRETGFGEGIALAKGHLCRMAGRRLDAAAAESSAVASASSRLRKPRLVHTPRPRRVGGPLVAVSDRSRLAQVRDCMVDSGSAGSSSPPSAQLSTAVSPRLEPSRRRALPAVHARNSLAYRTTPVVVCPRTVQ